jgi:RimJ/RimL family protein N-acetyltransferase
VRLEPVTLEGRVVRLEPLRRDHHAALCSAGLDPELWRWTAGHVDSAEEMHAYIDRALARQAEGTALPFATVERASGRIIGSTRFAHFEPLDRRVEIGWTWVARPWPRTGINVEAKYLMLLHAFGTLGLHRVELLTDALNAVSRKAIRGIGATEEGVLRRHMVTSRGRIRDTVVHSIVADEWPGVRARLEARLSAAGGRAAPPPTPAARS